MAPPMRILSTIVGTSLKHKVITHIDLHIRCELGHPLVVSYLMRHLRTVRYKAKRLSLLRWNSNIFLKKTNHREENHLPSFFSTFAKYQPSSHRVPGESVPKYPVCKLSSRCAGISEPLFPRPFRPF